MNRHTHRTTLRAKFALFSRISLAASACVRVYVSVRVLVTVVQRIERVWLRKQEHERQQHDLHVVDRLPTHWPQNLSANMAFQINVRMINLNKHKVSEKTANCR